MRAVVKPAWAASARTGSPWVSPISTTRVPAGASHSPAPATITSIASRPVGPGDERAARLPPGDLRGQRLAARDIGRVADDDVDAAAELVRAARRTSSPSTSRTTAARRPSPARLARATASASAEASVPHTSTSGQRSAATDRAIAPDPVPRSTSGAARRAARRWPARRRPRSPVAGSGPAGRRTGRACGTPTRRARTAAARRRSAGRTIWSTKRTSRSVTGSSSNATCSLGVRPLARSMIQRSSCCGSSTPAARNRSRLSSRSCRQGSTVIRRLGAGGPARRPRARRRRRRAHRPAPCRACRS